MSLRALCLINCAVTFAGCSSLPGSSPVESGIDAKYRFSRIHDAGIESAGTASPGVTVYQRVLSRTLGSHCSLYPSDSVYAQENMRRCGPLNATLKSMARFYLEPDSATLQMPVIRSAAVYSASGLLSDTLLFTDLPKASPSHGPENLPQETRSDCSLF